MLTKLLKGKKDSSSGAKSGAEPLAPKNDKKSLKGMSFDEGTSSLEPDENKGKGKGKGMLGKVGHGLKSAAKVGAMAAMPAYGMYQVGKAAAGPAKQAGKAMKEGAGNLADGIKNLGGEKDEFAGWTDEQMDAYIEAKHNVHKRVQNEYGPEVAQWLAQYGDDSITPVDTDKDPDKEMKRWVDEANDKAHKRAQTDKAAKAEAKLGRKTAVGAMDDRDQIAHDPFHYERKELNQKQVKAFKDFGLTQDEITAITLYTGGASYPMNEVLRGERTDEASIKAFLPWCLKLDSALAKMPKTVRNMTMGGKDATEHGKIDPTKKEGAMLDLAGLDVYRIDNMTDFMLKEVYANWRNGATISNASFFSTSTVRGSYAHAQGINRTIHVKDAGAAASVIDLSTKKDENEVLFRPNTQMRIIDIKTSDYDGKTTDVPDPSKAFDAPEKLRRVNLEVECEVTKAPPGLDKGKADTKAPPSPAAKGGKDDKDAEKKAAGANDNAAAVVDYIADTPFKDLL